MPLTEALEELRALLGQQLRTDSETRDEHAKDVCHHAAAAPDAVAYPGDDKQAAEILQICQRHRVPVIPFGTGTGVEGGVVATHGGVAVDTSRMNAILRVSELDRDCSVQAGVTRFQLNEHLAPSGLFFPIDPGADASLGGMAATCASGSAAVKYGTMRDNVLGLTAVTVDGRVIRTGGRARKSSAGYDLTRLLVGSEGTLALITSVTLRLHRIPEHISSASCVFESIEAAVDAAINIMAEGIEVARLELLDTTLIQAVNRYSQLDQAEQPSLLMEFQGQSSRHVEDLARRSGQVVERFGGSGFQWAADEVQRRRIWQARYDAYYACLSMRGGAIGYVTDVCVPITRLAECIQAAQRLVAEASFPAPLFGHVGDGNFHVVMLIRQGDSKELAEAQRIGNQIVEKALQCEGTCSGEHGIGLGKLNSLRAEYGQAVELMQAVKQAFDPLGLMNPGKVLAPPDD